MCLIIILGLKLNKCKLLLHPLEVVGVGCGISESFYLVWNLLENAYDPSRTRVKVGTNLNDLII